MQYHVTVHTASVRETVSIILIGAHRGLKLHTRNCHSAILSFHSAISIIVFLNKVQCILGYRTGSSIIRTSQTVNYVNVNTCIRMRNLPTVVGVADFRSVRSSRDCVPIAAVSFTEAMTK